MHNAYTSIITMCSDYWSEPRDSSRPAIYDGRAGALRVEEEGHRGALFDQGQQQALLFLPHLLPLQKNYDMGT